MVLPPMTLEIRAQEADVDDGLARLFAGLATSPCGYHLARVGRLAERQLSLDAFYYYTPDRIGTKGDGSTLPCGFRHEHQSGHDAIWMRNVQEFKLPVRMTGNCL
jgi:hypothetical protein